MSSQSCREGQQTRIKRGSNLLLSVKCKKQSLDGTSKCAVQSPGSHHGSEADELAVADMRVRLLAGLKRYLHGKRLNGLLSSEVWLL